MDAQKQKLSHPESTTTRLLTLAVTSIRDAASNITVVAIWQLVFQWSWQKTSFQHCKYFLTLCSQCINMNPRKPVRTAYGWNLEDSSRILFKFAPSVSIWMWKPVWIAYSWNLEDSSRIFFQLRLRGRRNPQIPTEYYTIMSKNRKNRDHSLYSLK